MLRVAQVWLWDELFYDVDAQRFTPDRFLADARERFGGLDGVVLWHAYPVIGIDERNQWDFYDVPGLPRRPPRSTTPGVRVFVDYNPWDTGTRRVATTPAELAAVIRRLGADGVFLDTLKNADPDFVAALDRGASRESASKASRSSRPSGSATTASRGRSGSPTRRRPACCARTSSSGGTCSTTSGAGTATTPRS